MKAICKLFDGYIFCIYSVYKSVISCIYYAIYKMRDISVKFVYYIIFLYFCNTAQIKSSYESTANNYYRSEKTEQKSE